MNRRFLFILPFLISTVNALIPFDPTVTVDVCTHTSLVVTLTNASDGGIIYVKGQSSACMQSTVSWTSSHTFQFASCGIQFDKSFPLRVVIQRKALYQTTSDKQVPISCYVTNEIGDITVGDNIHAEEEFISFVRNNTKIRTEKPTATMTLYKAGSNVGGATVKIADIITMVIALDGKYTEDFDIRASSCSSSTIKLITDSCSTDTDLFPHMSRIEQGILVATFSAFRTTTLGGGTTSMPFSCTLQVCLGPCEPITCADGDISFGRKKRSSDETMGPKEAGSAVEGTNTDIGSFSVGRILFISDVSLVTHETVHGELCMNTGVLIACACVMVCSLVATSITTAVAYRKLWKKASLIDQ